MKVVLTRNHQLPKELEHDYAKVKGFVEVLKTTEYRGGPVTYYTYNNGDKPVYWKDPAIRGDPLLVELVENSHYKDLVVVEIPDGVTWKLGVDPWKVTETIVEDHRVWGID